MIDAFNHYLMRPVEELSTTDLSLLGIDPKRNDRFVTAPPEFNREITRYLDNMLYVRRFASMFDTSKSGLPVAPYDRREFRPRSSSVQVKISKNALEKAKEPPFVLVSERLAYRFGLVQEREFLAGTGSGQALGLFTPSADGISWARDLLSAGATPVADDFSRALMMLDEEHRAKARWILHVDILVLAMKLKERSGKPLYDEHPLHSPSPTLAGAPFILSEFAPNKVAPGQYIAVVGNLSCYGIAESREYEIRATIEPHPSTNKNSYIARTSIDGMPLDEAAFVRLRVA